MCFYGVSINYLFSLRSTAVILLKVTVTSQIIYIFSFVWDLFYCFEQNITQYTQIYEKVQPFQCPQFKWAPFLFYESCLQYVKCSSSLPSHWEQSRSESLNFFKTNTASWFLLFLSARDARWRARLLQAHSYTVTTVLQSTSRMHNCYRAPRNVCSFYGATRDVSTTRRPSSAYEQLLWGCCITRSAGLLGKKQAPRSIACKRSAVWWCPQLVNFLNGRIGSIANLPWQPLSRRPTLLGQLDELACKQAGQSVSRHAPQHVGSPSPAAERALPILVERPKKNIYEKKAQR